jgi:hypothetical protein
MSPEWLVIFHFLFAVSFFAVFSGARVVGMCDGGGLWQRGSDAVRG